MTYRSLLVLLDHDPLCAARTRAAMQLAARLDCHLVGVAPTGLIDLPLSPGAASSLMDLAALAWDTLRDRAEEATQTFRDACRAAGVKSFEAVVDECDAAPSLVRHAHCSDLTIVTQADPGAAAGGRVRDRAAPPARSRAAAREPPQRARADPRPPLRRVVALR